MTYDSNNNDKHNDIRDKAMQKIDAIIADRWRKESQSNGFTVEFTANDYSKGKESTCMFCDRSLRVYDCPSCTALIRALIDSKHAPHQHLFVCEQCHESAYGWAVNDIAAATKASKDITQALDKIK